jgi:predicted house-cleaning noncanonical NTP pyrophosphatase (MazG superfamily)
MSGYTIKLVRDRIEEVGPARAIDYEEVTGSIQHRKLLRVKLMEEVGEYLVDPSVEELADIYQVLVDLAVTDLGSDIGEVRSLSRAKAEERGGFAYGVVMVAASIEEMK